MYNKEDHASALPALDLTPSPSPSSPPNSRRSLLTKLLEIEWNHHFPLNLETCKCTIRLVEPEIAFQFINQNYHEIFELELWKNPFFTEQQTEAKTQYYKECGDFFMIYGGELPIGILVGTLTDWSTYYIRSAGILREHQGNGTIALLLTYLAKILMASGINRIEADASVSNSASIQTLLRSRFKVTGMQLSERWGALLHFTNFLSAPGEKIFLDQYCHGARLQ